MAKKRVYLTTPAYYPSANPHIGNAYCSTLVDVLNRFFLLAGYETHFLTGTDEHGSKIFKNAKAEGKTPLEFVDPIVDRFKNLWDVLDVKVDDFIRTSEKRHIDCVQSIFSDFLKNEDVYLEKYEGWYCVYCESFWSDTQVGTEYICPDCGRPVNKEQEEVYFFNTKKYLPYLENILETNPTFIMPINRKNEMVNSFLKPGLTDLSVTRTTLEWGIPVKEDPKHVVYVWLDALVNYISALGYKSEDDSLFKKYWESEDSRIIHFVGADINRFHTIYWPMFLKALNLRAPDEVFVHGLIMTKDGKMSKSKGNAINPIPLIDCYGSDALRFYLTREMKFGENGQFTPEQFTEGINRDLVNNYGNLLNRTLTMINKYCDGIIPELKNNGDEVDQQLISAIQSTYEKYLALFEEIKPTEAITLVFELVDQGNKYIEVKKPWVLFKDENNKDEVFNTMAHLAYLLYVATNLLAPIITRNAPNALKQLGLLDQTPTFKHILDTNILKGLQVQKGDVLFPRLDVAKESDEIRKMMGV